MTPELVSFAQDAALPSSLSQMFVIAVTSAAAGIGTVYGWLRGDLAECKKDRKELFARVEALHGEVSKLSLRLGQTERKVFIDRATDNDSGGA